MIGQSWTKNDHIYLFSTPRNKFLGHFQVEPKVVQNSKTCTFSIWFPKKNTSDLIHEILGQKFEIWPPKVHFFEVHFTFRLFSQNWRAISKTFTRKSKIGSISDILAPSPLSGVPSKKCTGFVKLEWKCVKMHLEIQYNRKCFYDNCTETQLFVQEPTSQVHKIHHV